jgi:hypothetical protein
VTALAVGSVLWRVQWSGEPGAKVPAAVPVTLTAVREPGSDGGTGRKATRVEWGDDDRSVRLHRHAFLVTEGDPRWRPGLVALHFPSGTCLYETPVHALEQSLREADERRERATESMLTCIRQVDALRAALEFARTPDPYGHAPYNLEPVQRGPEGEALP